MRIIRLVRLVKLGRLTKQPRIMAKLKKYFTMPMKVQTLLKYCVLLFVIIHWSACTLRAVTGFVLGDCHPADDDERRCPVTYLTDVRSWEQGVWSQYFGAVLWALGALSGESYTHANMEETVLNVVIMLLGILVMAFLVGELANILGNYDPVGNAFMTTVDGLSTFLLESNFPDVLRFKLREYVVLSEPIYREKYYMSLIESMSPGLKEAIATHRLSGTVRNISFFSYAMRRGCGIVAYAVVSVYPPPKASGDPGASGCGYARRAQITTIIPKSRDAPYVVRYLDTDEEERVSHARIDVSSIGDELMQLQIATFNIIRKRFITHVALKLEPMLFTGQQKGANVSPLKVLCISRVSGSPLRFHKLVRLEPR